MIKYLLSTTFLILSLSIITFAQQSDSFAISIEQLKQKLNTDKDFILLDVRTAAELTGPLGKIDRAISIPIQQLASRISELNKYKEREIFVICRTQNRSSASADFLIRYGFNAKYVNGGMVEYVKNK